VTLQDVLARLERLSSLVRQLQGALGGQTCRGSSSSGTWAGGSPETTAVVAHGLGVTPTSVTVTPIGSSNVLASVDGGADDTSFTVRLRTRDGSSPAGGTERFFYWTASG